MENTERTPLLGGLLPGAAAAPISPPPTPAADVQSLAREESPAAEGSSSSDGPTEEAPTEDRKEDCVDGLLRPKAAAEVAVRMRDPAASSFTSSDLGMGEGAAARTYWQRFWVLLLFSGLAFFQCSMWSTWGPLSESVEAAYPNWGSSTVAMMANWGTLATMGFVLITSWFLHAFGLRAGVLTAAGMLALGTALRTLTVQDAAFTVLSHACAVLVGLAGTVFVSAPPMLAAVWFPPTERTTATAISLAANQLGTAGSYLESFFVRQPGRGVSPADVKEDIRGRDRVGLVHVGGGVLPPGPPPPRPSPRPSRDSATESLSAAS
nr:disrupted in renal carcinoma protein 2-like isoform X4 [Penaeus vannamei]XP_027230307.1 disrupted in renal carcinoma protein 2-like isoform X4 [Penaeus vannamei]XP_027230308.1 disrupted in renal carcinoma protein 2-like isoform X4 [Penaeus vannamei]